MRVLIFGLPGSGKTTFSNTLSKSTDTPVFHIDRHFFEPDGVLLKDCTDEHHLKTQLITGWKQSLHEV